MTAEFSIRPPLRVIEGRPADEPNEEPERFDTGPKPLSDILATWRAAREVGCIKGEQMALSDVDDYRIARWGK